MRTRKNSTVKRYCVFAKRANEKAWSDWTASDDINVAMKQVAFVRKLGYLGKVTDRKEQKVITSD